jgi:hypothetical protein
MLIVIELHWKFKIDLSTARVKKGKVFPVLNQLSITP